jgi:hypothetical protein
VTCGVYFCCELRPQATACLFKLGFKARRMSQQSVQLLWTQYKQSEHEDEQDFGSEAQGSPLAYFLIAGTGYGCGRAFFVSSDGCFETPNTFSNSFAKLRKFLGPEDKQCDSDNYQQMHGLKQSFKHNAP